ncbi:MAG: hypothetical protein Hals2KO_01650 [Halioglobus sp.]
MFLSKRRWIIAIAVALYLYFLLPVTATGFYELYHLTHIEPIYYGYGAFKAAGYYFGVWPYKLYACIGVGVLIIILPPLVRSLRGTK